MARVPQVREPTGDGQTRAIETSENRITIRETLDGLGIYNPARRKIVLVLFLMLWLTGWAFGEYFALSEIFGSGNVAGSLFLLFWVTFWTLGGLFVVRVLLWNLFGSELLFVTEGMLVHSRGIGPFRRKYIHPLADVGDFRLNLKGDPAGNAIPLGSIEYRAGGAARSFGVGMTREEAEASLAAIRRALPIDALPDAPGGEVASGE